MGVPGGTVGGREAPWLPGMAMEFMGGTVGDPGMPWVSRWGEASVEASPRVSREWWSLS